MSVLRFFSFSSFFHHWDPLSAMPTPLSCWSAEGFPCFTCTECIDTGASGSAWAGDKTSPRGARKVYRKDHSGKYETRLLGETRDPAACTSRCAPRLSGTWEPQSNSWAFFTGSMWRIWKLGRHKLKPILQLWVWFFWLLEMSFALPCVLPRLWGGHGTSRGNQAVWVISCQTAFSRDECKGKLRQGCETLPRELYQPRQFSMSEGRVHLISRSMVWLCSFFRPLLVQRKSSFSLMLEELLHSWIRDTNQDLLFLSTSCFQPSYL